MLKRLFAGLAALFLAQPAAAQNILELYVDADYSVNAAAAQAIELGVRTALDETGSLLGGLPVRLVPKDHRGNVRRSRNTFDQFIESPTALAIIGGLHSPPYLTYREDINRNGVLTLLPWSAAGPITRAAEGDENWLFRLSVDDFQSAPFLVREAVQVAGCGRVALVLIDTGWGRANENKLLAALRVHGQTPSVVTYFPATVGKAVAGSLADSVIASEAECAILLANAGNGAELVNALGDRNPDLRIFSHWGITGSTDFADNVGHARRSRMQIRVLQTCGLRREAEGNEVLRNAMAAGRPDVSALTEIRASSGFVHGYDLGRILVAAARQAAGTPGWQGDIAERRSALRQALETLQTPVTGILKTYDPPFHRYSDQAPDAHEALGRDDLCLAQFLESGQLADVD